MEDPGEPHIELLVPLSVGGSWEVIATVLLAVGEQHAHAGYAVHEPVVVRQKAKSLCGTDLLILQVHSQEWAV